MKVDGGIFGALDKVHPIRKVRLTGGEPLVRADLEKLVVMISAINVPEIALTSNGQNVLGITYYQHKETPGLGGEVDNPSWKALWPGKIALDETGQPIISVVKAGAVKNPDFEVDGMSGATITSKSVSNMLHLWLGDAAFGPYLQTKSGVQ